MAARSRTHSVSCAATSCAAATMDSTSSSKIFAIMRSAIQDQKRVHFRCGPKNVSLRPAAMKPIVAGAAISPAGALALWLLSAQALTLAYAPGWQPAAAEQLTPGADSVRKQLQSRAPSAPDSP